MRIATFEVRSMLTFNDGARCELQIWYGRLMAFIKCHPTWGIIGRVNTFLILCEACVLAEFKLHCMACTHSSQAYTDENYNAAVFLLSPNVDEAHRRR